METTANRRRTFLRDSLFGIAGLWASLCVAPGLAATPPDPPRAVVEETVGDVLGVLRDPGLRTEEKRRRVEAIVERVMDFRTISRLVLSRDWTALDERQKDDFVREFRAHLSATYGRNLQRYRDERVEIRAVREEPRGDRVVRTHVLRPAAENVSVDYRLRRIDGRWRVIDVSIEGISLVSNFRSQFREILANGGIDRLLGLLREKNVGAGGGPEAVAADSRAGAALERP